MPRMVTIVGSIVALFVVGCGAREIPPRYYVAQVTVNSDTPEPLPDESRPVGPGVGSVLPGGRGTIAFVPPSWCDTADSENKRGFWDQKACVSTVGVLERQASEAGYRVVDWRLFRRNPFEVAAAQHVDALVVIDDMVMERPSSDGAAVQKTEYAEQLSAAERVATVLENPKMVDARCDGAMRVRQRRRADSAELSTLSVSLKLVSVADGNAQWIYQHGVQRDDVAQNETQDYYYLSEGTKKTKRAKLIWGIAALALGSAAVVGGVKLNEDGTSFAARNLGFGLAWLSTVPFAIGATLTMVGLVAEVKKPVYQSPDEVLCARPPFVENPFSPDAAPESEETFVATPTERSLMDRLAYDFVTALQTASGTSGNPAPAVSRPMLRETEPKPSVATEQPPVFQMSPDAVERRPVVRTEPAPAPAPAVQTAPPPPPKNEKSPGIIIFNKGGEKQGGGKGGAN